MPNTLSLRHQIGQRLLVGFEGTALSRELITLVRDYKVSNVILFSRNLQSQGQMQALCSDIQRLVRQETGHPALIALDEEGGSVSRLPADCPPMPGAEALARSGGPSAVYQAALSTGRLLGGLGANLNLAPVLDINTNPLNPVIGSRSYGDHADIVTACALEAIRGYRDAGILCCGKHFPGHGDTMEDSHLALPSIDKELDALRAVELKPFAAAIEAGIPAIMSAHILFPRLGQSVPATLSRRLLTGLLREELGFNGLIFSDCLEMKAIADTFDSCAGGLMAMEAGADILCISHTLSLAAQIAAEAERQILAGESDPEAMEASARRILAVKKQWDEGAAI